MFDLDRTLIRIPAMAAVAPTLYRARLLGAGALWRAMRTRPAYLGRALSDADVARVGAVVLEIVHGWDAHDVQGVIEAATPWLVPRIEYPPDPNTH
ncbi:MAG: hypothetical protein ACRD0D_00685 [Acidimicrobiales bacterium]